ncbi:MAG: GTPase Era [Microthrixaceae bacterium]
MADPLAEMMQAAGLSPEGATADLPDGFRSGFVALVGRPNVGKSTLLNNMLGEKVSITSSRPQTTRHAIRGIMDRPDAQLVFVDTPGIHKPRTPMGERLNDVALSALQGVDVVCLVTDAASGWGVGDQRLAEQLGPSSVLVLNKIDRAGPARVAEQLTRAAEVGFAEYFPVSARSGDGVGALVEYLLSRMPEGPRWYPEGTRSDVGERFQVAELVREQLLAVTRDELPHSIATEVTEWEWPRIRVEITVERDSQKPIVIGKGGSVLKEVGTRVRRQLPEGAFVELHVSVDRDWQRNPRSLDRHGYGT